MEYSRRAVSFTPVWGRGWVIDYSSGVSMGFAGGQAEVVEALWAMRGWLA